MLCNLPAAWLQVKEILATGRYSRNDVMEASDRQCTLHLFNGVSCGFLEGLAGFQVQSALPAPVDGLDMGLPASQPCKRA